MCECEIAFIRKLMPALGFGTEYEAIVRKVTSYQWEIDRPNNEPFVVYLTVHADADKILTDLIASAMAPDEANSLAPNLKRVAVVSSPVMDPKRPGERAEEKLNAALKKALADAKEKTAEYGWRWDWPGDESDDDV